MFKFVFVVCMTISVTSLLASCANEQYTNTETATTPAAPVATEGNHTDTSTAELQPNIMQEPVDFSSPENVQKSLRNVREQAGDNAVKALETALQYVLFYDLSVGNDKDKMYQMLDGQSPEQIIAKMKR